MLALPITSSGSKGSDMLIGDPLGEGSNASSTNSEIWRVENSFLKMRGNSDAQEWGPRHKQGLTSSNKGNEAACVTLPYGFLERTQNIRCAILPLGGFRKVPKV